MEEKPPGKPSFPNTNGASWTSSTTRHEWGYGETPGSSVRRSSAPLSQRQAQHNRRALPQFALGVDRAAVRLDDVLHDGQPEPGAAGRAAPALVDPVKALENMGQVIRRNAGAVVGHAHLHPAVAQRMGK